MHVGLYKNPCCFKCPQIMLSFFYSYRFLRWWALCTRHLNFPAFCGCESILGRKSTNVIFCFHFLSCSFHVAFKSFHVAIMSFHVPFMFLLCSFCVPFMFLSCSCHCCIHFLSCSVAMYQTYWSSKGYMLEPVRSVSVQMLVLFSYFVILFVSFCYRFAIVLEACAGYHLQGSWTCTCISSLSFDFYSDRFLGR